jgi:outer membrane protein
LNKLWRLLLAASLVLVSVHAMAETKVGYVQMKKIMQSPQSLESGAKLQKEFGPRGAELERLKKQINDKDAAFTKESPTMSESVRRTKAQEISNLKITFERKQRDMQDSFEVRKREELTNLQNRVNNAVTSVAQSEGYDLVLYNTGAYIGSRVDITDKVINAIK